MSPSYTYENIHTSEQFEVIESWNESQKRLDSDKNLIRVIGAPNIVSGVGAIKVDGAFRETMSKIAEDHPIRSKQLENWI